MEAIKKNIAALKKELDGANETVDTNEVKAKQENLRADTLFDEVRDLEKKLIQMEHDFETIKTTFDTSSAELEQCEKQFTKAEQDRTMLTKRVQDIEEQLQKKEEYRDSATIKLVRASELADDAKRMCKVLEERSKADEERTEKLTSDLKDARLIAEDADTKSEEAQTKLQLVEEELESAEERVKTSEAKIIEREDELFIVKNIVKSLEVSEQKANRRVEEFKLELKNLKMSLKMAEKRAVHAERTVKQLMKDVDRKEDELREEKEKYRAMCDDLDLTYAEMTGF